MCFNMRNSTVELGLLSEVLKNCVRFDAVQEVCTVQPHGTVALSGWPLVLWLS
jgi:hypothetical protein